jgi:hypothetical protein
MRSSAGQHWLVPCKPALSRLVVNSKEQMHWPHSLFAPYLAWSGLRGPPVRWRAAHPWLFSTKIKFNTSGQRSGKLVK